MKFLRILILLVLSIHSHAQSRHAVLLDMTARNSELTDGNCFSAKQILTISGIDYSISTDVNSAVQNAFILCSSNIESSSFSQVERDTLTAFVNRGGVLVATNVKDPLLYSLFGVSNYNYSNSRHFLYWTVDANDKALHWIDDVNEQTLQLGDTSYSAIYGTRGYSVSTGTVRATFDDLSAALVQNNFGTGFTYVFGMSWKDVVLRNESERHYGADRTYSNGFEPQTDVFALYIRAVYSKHIPFAVWKHTSGLNSKATLIITHDVDATTGMGMMNDFAGYERSNNITATYFVTTHYMHDSLAKNFYTNFVDTLQQLVSYGMEIASHSVSHVPDFADTSIVHPGTCGNNEFTYQPFWNAHYSSGVTLCGETEVSKNLLVRDLGVNIRAFRAGYLAYNPNLIRSLENNGYEFNSSHSANNVLTAFPFQAHYGLSSDSALSSVYEIPNCISDVFTSNPISDENHISKAAIWTDVVRRNAMNNAPTVLLIHPNRLWKIDGEQYLLLNMPAGMRTRTYYQYGDFWKMREKSNFTTTLIGDSVLYITIDSASLPLNSELSFVVDGGQALSHIFVQDYLGNPIQMLQTNWDDSDKIIHSRNFSEQYNLFNYNYNAFSETYSPYPNPFSSTSEFEIDLTEMSQVILNLYDVTGRLVKKDLNENMYMGEHTIVIHGEGLDAGTYIYELIVNGRRTKGKIVLTENR